MDTNVDKAKHLLRRRNREEHKVVRLPTCSETSSAACPSSGDCGEPVDLCPPAYLTDEIAIREWETVAPILARRDLLDDAMKPLLAGYCNALARSVHAERVLSKEGRYYKTTTQKGCVMRRRHPAVQDAEEGWASVRLFAKQLGLSSPAKSAQARTPERRRMFK